MLDSIIFWSLKNRWVVLLGSVLLMIFGIQSIQKSSLDVFPNFAPPQVVVQTEMPGMTPEEIENLITTPLENALNGTPKTKTIRSFSTPGLSAITIIFEWNTDQYLARQLINERLQLAASRLPSEAKPSINPISSPVGNILTYAFTAKETSPQDLRTLVDWPIRQRLLSVSGITNLSVYGGESKQYQVLIEPDKLKQFNISLEELETALKNANLSLGGGYIVRHEREFLVKPQSRISSLEDLASSVIKSNSGTPITLSQVAEIKIGNNFKRGDGSFNGESAVIMQVYKRPGVDTLKVSNEAKKALKELQKSFPADVKLHKIYDQSDYILSSVQNVGDALRDGAILVTIVLFLFLWNWRTSFISLIAIPLSILTALLILRCFGLSINVMTLGGLAIALGEVVDDAVIDVENVYRRLRENQELPEIERKNSLDIIFEASKEIRSSVVFATIIVILVFIPIFALGGIEGELFKPLGYAYITSIGASLLVALTVTPVLCWFLLAKQKNLPHQEPKFITSLKRHFSNLFDWSLQNRKLLFSSSVGLFGFSILLFIFIGKGFLPELGEKNMIVMTYLKPGSSLIRNVEIGKELEKTLLKIPGVDAVVQRAGRSFGDDEPLDSNISHLDIALKHNLNDLQTKRTVEKIQDVLNNLPGLSTSGGSFLTHAIEDVLSGVRAQIVIKVFGNDSNILQEKAEEVSSIISKTKGSIDLQIEPIIQVPQIKVEINRQAASRYGLNSGEIAKFIEITLNGKEISRVYEENYSFPIYLWTKETARNTIGEIEELLIDTPAGMKIPLKEIASFKEIKAANTVKHEGLSKRLAISCNVKNRDLVGFMNEVKHTIDKEIKLKSGYYFTYGGEYEAQSRASKQMSLLTILVIIGIFIVLIFAFASLPKALLIMLNLPLALIGGIIALLISGQILDIASLIGFVTLFGISTRNGIMLVTHFEHLEKEKPNWNSLQIVKEGTLDRLTPVLMTALCAALAMLPLALFPGSGREIEHPLAIVILGGMFTSTFLTLLIIPIGYLWLSENSLLQNSMILLATKPYTRGNPLK